MKYLFAISLFLLVILLLPSSSYAVVCNGVENNLNLCYPVLGDFNINTVKNIGEVIGFLYAFLVVISGVLAFGMLVWAGITWLTSAGNPSKISDARDRIRNTFLGLLLVLASFLLLQILNPDLTLITTLSS